MDLVQAHILLLLILLPLYFAVTLRNKCETSMRRWRVATATADEEHSSKVMMETLEELEWCLEQLETIQTHKSVSDMATSKVHNLLYLLFSVTSLSV